MTLTLAYPKMSSISISEQILELLDGQTGVTDNCPGSFGIN
jgi:hypothetical protein